MNPSALAPTGAIHTTPSHTVQTRNTPQSTATRGSSDREMREGGIPRTLAEGEPLRKMIVAPAATEVK
jgi:hypothetical protein